ncbi:MAG TPA: NAD(P)H-binding protein [Thermoanaerobaculia bacterium]|nr:NAD(P)H-binding protein [Thermoanaerobaculia bacterium]
MKILVTGGTGVIGEGLISELLSRGHAVRLLSRHAQEDAKQWTDVEPFIGDIAEASSVTGAADGCDVVLHIAGIAAEDPPKTTFATVNVGGTRNVIAEATRAQVKRFVFVSSLGADTGTSDYHRSKRDAEQLVQQSALDWTIVRPGNVYGPGDEVISLVLKLVRTMPAVPVIDDGEQEFQPLWHEDLAKVLAASAERVDLSGQVIEAAGPDVTTMNDLLRRFAEITGRSPIRIPVPAMFAQLAARLTPVDLPVDENKLTMLEETNVVRGVNALELLGIEGTSLDRGLRLLADALPEALAEDGVGALEHKRFYANIRGSRHSAAALMTQFRERVNDFMPIEFVAEPGAATRIEKGATLTGALPLRGNFQVRVEVAEPTHVVLATIEGHPLAGIVEFTSGDTAGGLTFSIDVYARASNFLDWVASRTVGAPAQNANWRTVVQRVIDASGGTSDGVHEEKEKLSDEEAVVVEKRVKGIVQERKREETEARM